MVFGWSYARYQGRKNVLNGGILLSTILISFFGFDYSSFDKRILTFDEIVLNWNLALPPDSLTMKKCLVSWSSCAQKSQCPVYHRWRRLFSVNFRPMLWSVS